MRRRFVWAFLALLTGILAPIGCSAGNAGVGGGGEQNILAPTVTGNVICFPLPKCEPVYIVITATQFTAWTPTPTVTLTASPTQPAPTLPSSTPRPPNTPTPATPPVIDVTSISNSQPCVIEPYAVNWKGVYTYLDEVNSGLLQRIRSRPGTEWPIVGYLPKNEPRLVFYLKWRGGVQWYAITQACDQWVSGALGTFED